MSEGNLWARVLSVIVWLVGGGLLIRGLTLDISVATSVPREIYGVTINSLDRVANISLVAEKIATLIVACLLMLSATIAFVGAIVAHAVRIGRTAELVAAPERAEPPAPEPVAPVDPAALAEAQETAAEEQAAADRLFYRILIGAGVILAIVIAFVIFAPPPDNSSRGPAASTNALSADEQIMADTENAANALDNAAANLQEAAEAGR